MRNKLIVIIFITLFSTAYTASAQKQINTPYSRFNIGTLQPQGTFRSLGMGGIGTAMRDNSSIYFTNPSSYSSLDTISFVFDFGLDLGSNYISDGTTRFSSNDINFHHLVMGFPLSKHWGVAIGMAPVSSGYYQIIQTVSEGDASYDPITGAYTATHTGAGGIIKYFVGTGLQIGKHLSFGANFSILSGQIKRNNIFIFSDYYNVFHDNSQENLEISGINFDYGIQYKTTIRNNYFLNIGVSATAANNYNSKYNLLAVKYTAYGITDTVNYVQDNSAKTYIPATYRFGISFGRRYKFTAGLDYVMTQWSKSQIPGSTGYAADTRELLFGAEYIPDKFSNYSYINRIEYRLGGHIGNDYLILNGEQLKEYGASMGFGLPLRGFSKTNLYFDYTRKTGSPKNNIHTEDYLTIGISLNLYDNWFMKRKYD